MEEPPLVVMFFICGVDNEGNLIKFLELDYFPNWFADADIIQGIVQTIVGQHPTFEATFFVFKRLDNSYWPQLTDQNLDEIASGLFTAIDKERELRGFDD